MLQNPWKSRSQPHHFHSVCRPVLLWQEHPSICDKLAGLKKPQVWGFYTGHQWKKNDNTMPPICFHFVYLNAKLSLMQPANKIKLEIRNGERRTERCEDGSWEPSQGMTWKATKWTVYESHITVRILLWFPPQVGWLGICEWEKKLDVMLQPNLGPMLVVTATESWWNPTPQMQWDDVSP